MEQALEVFNLTLAGDKKGAMKLFNLQQDRIMAQLSHIKLKEELNNGGLTKRHYNKIIKLKRDENIPDM